MSRNLAATYIGVSLSMWDKMVAEGRMPPPKRFYGRTIWDRVAVDAAFDILDGGNRADVAGDEVYDFLA